MLQILHLSLQGKSPKHRKWLPQVLSRIQYPGNNLKMLASKAYTPFLQYPSSFKKTQKLVIIFNRTSVVIYEAQVGSKMPNLQAELVLQRKQNRLHLSCRCQWDGAGTTGGPKRNPLSAYFSGELHSHPLTSPTKRGIYGHKSTTSLN